MSHIPILTHSIGGNTAGVLANIQTGTYFLAGGNNITLSQNANSVTISGGAGGGAEKSITLYGNTAGTTTFTQNPIYIGGGLNISLSGEGLNSFVINASEADIQFGVSNVGNTAGTTGMAIGSLHSMLLVGTNGITLSQSKDAQNITISISGGGGGAGATMKSWTDHQHEAKLAHGHTQTQLSLRPVYFPAQLNATRFDVVAHMTGSSAAASGRMIVRMGLYTVTNSTANLATSGSFNLSWTSGSATSQSSVWGGNSGTRYRSGSLATWNITQGNYILGLIASTETSQTAHTWSLYGGSVLSIQASPGGGNYLNAWIPGLYSVATGGFPASLHITNINNSGANAIRHPWIQILGT